MLRFGYRVTMKPASTGIENMGVDRERRPGGRRRRRGGRAQPRRDGARLDHEETDCPHCRHRRTRRTRHTWPGTPRRRHTARAVGKWGDLSAAADDRAHRYRNLCLFRLTAWALASGRNRPESLSLRVCVTIPGFRMTGAGSTASVRIRKGFRSSARRSWHLRRSSETTRAHPACRAASITNASQWDSRQRCPASSAS